MFFQKHVATLRISLHVMMYQDATKIYVAMICPLRSHAMKRSTTSSQGFLETGETRLEDVFGHEIRRILIPGLFKKPLMFLVKSA